MFFIHTKKLASNSRAINKFFRCFLNRIESLDTMSKREISSTRPNFSRFYLEVLSNGSKSNSLLVFTDQNRFLFNCGETTQRLASENGSKLFRARTMFVTSICWENIGGILGWALTLQSLKVKEATLYGPPGIEKLISATQAFVSLKSLKLKVISDLSLMKSIQDSLIIQAVPLYWSSENGLGKKPSDSVLSSAHNSNKKLRISPTPHEENHSDNKSINEINVISGRKRKRCHSETRDPTSFHKNIALCYICKTPEILGKLSLEKCLNYGVPVGPLLGKLKKREDIVLEDGKIVRWKDVIMNNFESLTFIVVDCPTKDYLDSLLNEPKLMQCRLDTEKTISVVVHFTPPAVMFLPKYKQWMSQFSSATKHLIINSDNPVQGQLTVGRFQSFLHYLHPFIYPRLNVNIPTVKDEFSGKLKRGLFQIVGNIDKDTFSEDFLNNSKCNEKLMTTHILKSPIEFCSKMEGLDILHGITSLRLQLFPHLKYDYSHRLCLDPMEYYHEVTDVDRFKEEVKSLSQFTRELFESEEFRRSPDYPKIVFLGTGSSVPSGTRNTTGILIYLDEDNIMLMDCGEGTYFQMLQLFGEEKLSEVMANLKLIYISHPHADHHLGLVNILSERRKILQKIINSDRLKEVYLLLPSPVLYWLHMFHNSLNPILDNITTIRNSELETRFQKLPELLRDMGIEELKTVPVNHCLESYGVTFTTFSGCKITYSGDTKPSSNLIRLGRNSNILIHEATLEDGMESMAQSKRHSTVSQAIQVGQDMEAKYILLTHFSQRYSHVIQMPEDVPANVGIAYDFMTVREKDFPIVSKLSSLYRIAFPAKMESLFAKTQKRQFKEEREERLRMQGNVLVATTN